MNCSSLPGWLLLVSMSACLQEASSQDVCTPDCTTQKPGDKLADPYDCTRYYLCMSDNIPSDSSLPCPEGHFFDAEVASCAPGVECEALCHSKECFYTCDENLEVVSDPFHCGRYYMCLPSGPVSHTCPGDRPFFNGATCVDRYDCCSDPCIPHCVVAGSQIPDPKNCTMFYVCLEEGETSEALHFQCPPGDHYDASKGFCYPGEQCSLLCDPPTTTTELPTTTTELPTTTTKPPTTTTEVEYTSTTWSPDCSASFLCMDVGSFHKYPVCVDEYFACYKVGVCAVIEKCKGGTVFNPIPDYPYCIVPELCPYTPVEWK